MNTSYNKYVKPPTFASDSSDSAPDPWAYIPLSQTPRKTSKTCESPFKTSVKNLPVKTLQLKKSPLMALKKSQLKKLPLEKSPLMALKKSPLEKSPLKKLPISVLQAEVAVTAVKKMGGDFEGFQKSQLDTKRVVQKAKKDVIKASDAVVKATNAVIKATEVLLKTTQRVKIAVQKFEMVVKDEIN